MTPPPRTIALIDASNLFYGGEKSLGWRIDYNRLAFYLKKRYNCQALYYFGGIEIDGFPYDYQTEESVDVAKLKEHFSSLLAKGNLDNEFGLKLAKQEAHASFYAKLQEFGYTLLIKPVKTYGQGTEARKKANCDVDLTLYALKEAPSYDRAVILSGDGDFLPVLKYLRDSLEKEIVILARSNRTAREMKSFAGAGFRDFETLRNRLEYGGNKKPGGHPAISSPSLVHKN